MSTTERRRRSGDPVATGTPLASNAPAGKIREKDDSAFRDASRADFVYSQVRDAIQDGVYPQGTRIREEEVARDLGVSRTPVREGLRRLESHGLLELAPGRGLVVVSLTKKQIIDLYTVMEMLEGSAARLAAQNASAVEIQLIEHVLDVFDATKGDARRYSRLNHEFHDAVYAAAKNEYLQKSLERLWDALASVPSTTYQLVGRPESASEEHRAILRAIKARQSDEAEWAARKHIREVLRHRTAMLFG